MGEVGRIVDVDAEPGERAADRGQGAPPGQQIARDGAFPGEGLAEIEQAVGILGG